MSNNWYDLYSGIFYAIRNYVGALSVIREWYNKNADKIAQYVKVFAQLGVWYSAVKVLSEHQIVFTDDLSVELSQRIIMAENVDDLIFQYYFDGEPPRINRIIENCQQSSKTLPYRILLEETIAAYRAGHFHLSCVGMFAIVDGILSDFTESQDTSFKKRMLRIEQKFDNNLHLDDMDKKTICIYHSMTSFEDSIFKNSGFKGSEPETLNRHWVIHGKTRRQYTQYDFLKILLWLDAVIFIDEKMSKDLLP